MPTRYIADKTARLYEDHTGYGRKMVLIFGDEVEVSGDPKNGRRVATFRGRDGWINEDDLREDPALEIYFIDVGQGDATFLVTPGRKTILVDGGMNQRALGFLSWKYRLDRGGDPIDIDLMVVTHADADHINGLSPIVAHPKIDVHRIVHNGIATYQRGATDEGIGNLDEDEEFLVTRHESLDELDPSDLSDSFSTWKDAILGEPGAPDYEAVDRSQGTIDIGDPSITLEVLGPRLSEHNGEPAYKWFGDRSHTINGHSVVLRLVYDDVRVLLSGDLNIEGSEHLLEDSEIAADLDAHVFKSPHHGSHEFERSFLQAVKPQLSVISSGDSPDHGHPRASFIGAVGQASRSELPLVFSTEIATTFVEAPEIAETAAERDEEADPNALAELDARAADMEARARRYFKRRLHGMINVRTDGEDLYAARRVTAGYWWESYGPMKPIQRWTIYEVVPPLWTVDERGFQAAGSLSWTEPPRVYWSVVEVRLKGAVGTFRARWCASPWSTEGAMPDGSEDALMFEQCSLGEA